MAWAVYGFQCRVYHVYPHGDEDLHDLHGLFCWCGPHLDGSVVVHHLAAYVARQEIPPRDPCTDLPCVSRTRPGHA